MTTHYLDDPDNRCGGKNCDGSCCKPVDYKALWEQMCERCDYLDKIAAQLQALCDMQALRLGERENCKPLTDEKLRAMWANYAPIVGGVLEFARAIEKAHGIGVEHDAR